MKRILPACIFFILFIIEVNSIEIALNSPQDSHYFNSTWILLNATFYTNDTTRNMTTYFYANNNSNGLNASEGLVYIAENVVNGSILTYNLTSLPIKQGDPNLILLMHFDNRSEFGENSSKVYDFSNNNKNGTVYGNLNYTQSGGKFGGAYIFKDIELSYINATNVAIDNVTAFTASVWMKQSTLDKEDFIFSKGTSSANRVSITSWSDGNMYADPCGWNNRGYFDYSPYITANKWHHLVMVFNGTATGNSNKLKIYVDGNNVSLTFGGTITNYSGNNPIESFLIGGVSGALTYPFNGTLDDLAVWNRSLSRNEVQSIYALGEGIYYWKANATDAAASNESPIWNFVIGTDTTPPIITLVNPTDINVTVTTRNWVYINITGSETLENCTLNWNNYAINYSMFGPQGTVYWYNVSSLTNANYTYRATCNDTSGNMGNSSIVWVNSLMIISSPAPVTGGASPSYGISAGAVQQELNKTEEVKKISQCKPDTFTKQLFSSCKIADNDKCDYGENYLVDEDCKVTLEMVKSGEILKSMWFLRCILLFSIFLLARDSKRYPFIVLLLIVLFIYNGAFIPQGLDTGMKCIDVNYVINAGYCIMPASPVMGWLLVVLMAALIITATKDDDKRNKKRRGQKKQINPETVVLTFIMFILFFYNWAIVGKGIQADPTKCVDVGFLYHFGECVMPTNPIVGWLIGLAVIGVFIGYLDKSR